MPLTKNKGPEERGSAALLGAFLGASCRFLSYLLTRFQCFMEIVWLTPSPLHLHKPLIYSGFFLCSRFCPTSASAKVASGTVWMGLCASLTGTLFIVRKFPPFAPSPGPPVSHRARYVPPWLGCHEIRQQYPLERRAFCLRYPVQNSAQGQPFPLPCAPSPASPSYPRASLDPLPEFGYVPPAHGNDVAAFAVGDVLWNLRRLGGPHVSEQSRPLPNGGHCSVSVSREAPRRHINAAACDAVCFGIDPSGREKVCESVRQAHNGPHAPQQIVSPVLIARNTARVHSSPVKSHPKGATDSRLNGATAKWPFPGFGWVRFTGFLAS